MEIKKRKVLVIIGGGGFTSETISLLESVSSNKLIFVISGGNHFDHISYKKLSNCSYNDIHILTVTNPAQMKISRIEKFFSYISNIIETSIIVFNRRYDICLGVGTYLCVFFFIFSKLKRIPCIYVETITRSNKLSITGNIIYFLGLASRFYVYHKQLVTKYKKAIYVGII